MSVYFWEGLASAPGVHLQEERFRIEASRTCRTGRERPWQTAGAALFSVLLLCLTVR